MFTIEGRSKMACGRDAKTMSYICFQSLKLRLSLFRRLTASAKLPEFEDWHWYSNARYFNPSKNPV